MRLQGDSPALYMRQSSAHWESVNNLRRPPLMRHPLFVRLQPGCFADRLTAYAMSPERFVKDVFGPYKAIMAERVGFEPANLRNSQC
jgi:hypothetical protein